MKVLFPSVMLAGAMAITVMAGAQVKISETDVAVTYTAERAKIAPSNCGCFWLNGASADGAVTLFKGFGVAANLTGEHASNVTPGVNLGKLSYMAGPRYTYSTARFTGHLLRKHAPQVFGEWLFGGVHAFDSTFPASNGVTPTANAFSTQLGAGLDVAIFKGLGVRALELDYVHTSLPNNGSNSQNDLRLAFGLSYRR